MHVFTINFLKYTKEKAENPNNRVGKIVKVAHDTKFSVFFMKKFFILATCLFGLALAPECVCKYSCSIAYAQEELGQKVGNFTAQLCKDQYQMGETYTVEVYKTSGGAITVMFRGQKCSAWYERECKECMASRTGYFFSCNGKLYKILGYNG